MNEPGSDQLKHRVLELDYARSRFLHIPLGAGDVARNDGSCAVCGSETRPLTRVSDDLGNSLLEKSICRECGYVAFNQMPTQAWYRDFYRFRWDRGGVAERQVKPSVFSSHRKNIDLLQSAEPNRRARVLDVGAGYGGFLSNARELGYTDLHGIEASQHRVDFCRRDKDLAVQLALIEEAPSCFAEMLGEFDVVHSHHVLEHVYDINAAIAAINTLLRPGGRLILFVPNLMDEAPFMIAHFVGHIRQFTASSLSMLLRRHGFRIERIEEDLCVVAVKEAASTAAGEPAEDIDMARLLDDISIKFDRETGLSGPSSQIAASTPFWQVSASGTNESRLLLDCDLPLPRRAAFWTKRLLFTTRHRAEPLNGSLRHLWPAAAPRSLAIRLCQRLLPFGRFEAGGRILVEQVNGADRVQPLLEYRYAQGRSIAVIK